MPRLICRRQLWVVFKAVTGVAACLRRWGATQRQSGPVPPPVSARVCRGVHAHAQPRVLLLWCQYREDKHPKLCPREDTNIKFSKLHPKQFTGQGGQASRGQCHGAEHEDGMGWQMGAQPRCTGLLATQAPGPQVTCRTASLPPASYGLRTVLVLASQVRPKETACEAVTSYPRLTLRWEGKAALMLQQGHPRLVLGVYIKALGVERLHQPKDGKEPQSNHLWVFCPVTWRLDS